MNGQTSFTVPQSLYERVRRIAREQQRDVTEVVAEVFERGLPLLEETREQAALRTEIEAFNRLHPSLLEDHFGDYVAICKGKVIDHDHRYDTLLARVDAAYPDEVVLIRRVESDREIVYQHRSVRWS